MAGAAVAAAPTASAGTPGGTHANDRNCDFNGDGYEDVLIGAPGAVAGGSAGAGLVTVQYGSAKGIGTAHAKAISRATPGVPGPASPGDGFGTAVASGDLDSDGYDDAIVGVPGDDRSGVSDAGGALVLWGSPDGLTGADSTWVGPEAAEENGRFGAAVAAARLSGATPGDVLAVLDRADVRFFLFDAAPGSGGGGDGALAPERRRAHGAFRALDATTRDATTRGTAAARAGEPRRALAPRSLTTGDYDNDGYADLVVSGVTTGTGTDPGRGWSAYLAGGPDGPAWVRDLRGGPVAASGDIDGDGYDDLVTGEPDAPGEAAGARPTGGVVTVHYGSPQGPGGPGTRVQDWTQDSDHVPGTAERGDAWGADISVGDANGDGYADVAVGAPGEDQPAGTGGSAVDAGSVTVLPGTPAGLTGTGSRAWSQSSPHVPGTAEAGDRWGAQVRLVDPDADGRFDLVAAAPGENAGDGKVWLLPATARGITATGAWTYGAGALGAAPHGAAFGAAIDE
ncbi:FG-GAP repeat protein [Streptomyces sp. TS71-3]|uniref:FG-GAP repeat protein n=1 Tax=Streptomyces sp. TS71-3 TaxID=2733862 RepID=UPI0035ABFCE1